MQKALFLDRDGIINIDHGYVSKIEDFQFTEGIFNLFKLFLDKGFIFFIVTNQSGIGRGYYSEEDFLKLTSWMIEEFKKRNIHIVSVEYCSHAPEENCYCRKPQIGMIENILSKYNIDLDNSWLIGDKQSDIDLAHNAMIANTIAIGEREIKNATYDFKTILECKEFLEKNKDIITL